MQQRLGSRLVALATIVVALVAWGASPARAESFEGDAAQQLADRFAPIAVLTEQSKPCAGDGEQFLPMDVDAVLGNPQIALRQVGANNPVVKWAPEASDLYDLGEGFFLDFPGDALEPGCIYEKDGRRFERDLEPTVYAHVVTQDDRPGQLVVEYWFYWYYNDWNNKHESDWEGIQLVFDAETPEQALTQVPTAVGFAQHEGGERASWDSHKVNLDGDHILVYPSVGSHASYYGADLHMGTSGSEGFGCDNTSESDHQVPLAVVLLPGAASGPDDPYAWLGFTGHWGELHGGPYNGPTGPAAKGRWDKPLDWQDDLRASSVIVPSATTQSGALVEVFCNVVGWGSNQVISLASSPAKTIATFVIVGLIIAYLLRRTTWDRTSPVPLVARRRSGEILSTAAWAFRRAPGTFLAIGGATVLVALVPGLLATLVRYVPFIGPLVQGDPGSSTFVVSMLAATLGSAFGYVFVSAAVVCTLEDLSAGRAPSASRSIAAVGSRWRPLLGAYLLMLLVALLGAVFVVIGWIGVFLLVRAAFTPQAVMVPGAGLRGALGRSWALTKGRWFHTAITIGLILLAIKLISTAIGLLVLVLLGPPFWVLTPLIVVLDAIISPIAGICIAYLYGDATAQQEAVGPPPADAGIDAPVPTPA